MIKRIYLAGPDVFLPDGHAIGQRKVELCQSYGFTGLFPLDNAPPPSGMSPSEAGLHIYRANVALMRSADAIMANMTPFRGPSADVGTAFELGFFAAMERPVFAYSADPQGFAGRTRSLLGLSAGADQDADGFTIEPFELPDNLMLPGAVLDCGSEWVAVSEAGAPALAAMAAFEQCLAALAAREHAHVQRSSMTS